MSRRPADDRGEGERPDRDPPPEGKDIAVPANAAVAANVLAGDPIAEPDDDADEDEDNRPT